MPYSGDRATYESELARAHRAMFRATEAASRMGSPGDEIDCEQITREIVRLAEASLKGRNRQVRPLAPNRA